MLSDNMCQRLEDLRNSVSSVFRRTNACFYKIVYEKKIHSNCKIDQWL